MALTSRERLVKSFTFNIYVDGTRSFTGHNGKPTITASYHTDVKICAAGLLSIDQIDAALLTDKITVIEHGETMAYIGTPEAEAWKTK